MADCSVDAVVCDPPYALPGGFMGKSWDNHDGREDTGFGYWLAGFTDGEGCFRVQRHERGTHVCAFQIKLRRDDRAVLERIRRYVGHGTVRDVEGSGNSKDQATYVVQDQQGCEALVGLFRRFPLTAKKALDFEVWADAVGEWVNRPRGNRWHGAADQSQASALKARLENVRTYVEIPWSGHRFQDWCRLWAAECLRVLKPGGYLLAFGAPRQYHRLACGIEDAGFEVRDCLGWVFGSGFPKSKNFDGKWAGWGTALKPAWESIVMARKPLAGTVAANVLEHGTGALNVDGCRVGSTVETWPASRARPANGQSNALYTNRLAGQTATQTVSTGDAPSGRWPANLIHDGSDEVVGLFPAEARSSCGGGKAANAKAGYSGGFRPDHDSSANQYFDSGSAARFFKQCGHAEADLADDTDATVKPWKQPAHSPARDTDAPTQEAEGIGPDSGLFTTLSGSSPMDQSPTECKSTTSTETRRTTGLKTCSLSPQQSTSASIPSTSGVDLMATGSASAPAAINGSKQLQSTSTSARKAGCSMDAADHATLPESLPINEPGVKRLYYTAKATRAERQGTSHPTTKPLDLMAYLCRLVTPPGGTVLDPFMGSGTTIKAAIGEGFNAIGIERDPAYFAMAEHRMNGAQLGLTLTTP
jgi:DNA modification methylase